MNELLFESPITIAVIGVIFTGLTVFGWMQTGNPTVLKIAAAIFVGTLLMLGLERWVETDRESLTAEMYRIADDLQNNRREQIYAAIHPSATSAVAQARSELPNYEFKEARIASIRGIEVDTKYKPTRATARFNVFVNVSVRGQSFRIPRYVEVVFYKEPTGWKVYSYQHDDATEGLIKL